MKQMIAGEEKIQGKGSKLTSSKNSKKQAEIEMWEVLVPVYSHIYIRYIVAKGCKVVVYLLSLYYDLH